MFMNFHSFLVKYNGVWTHSPHSSWVFPLKHLFPVYLRGQNTHIKTRKPWNVSFFFFRNIGSSREGRSAKSIPAPSALQGIWEPWLRRSWPASVLTCSNAYKYLQLGKERQTQVRTDDFSQCRLLRLSFYGLAGVFIVNHFQMEIYFTTISG